jgi:hypothetical protein
LEFPQIQGDRRFQGRFFYQDRTVILAPLRSAGLFSMFAGGLGRPTILWGLLRSQNGYKKATKLMKGEGREDAEKWAQVSKAVYQQVILGVWMFGSAKMELFEPGYARSALSLERKMEKCQWTEAITLLSTFTKKYSWCVPIAPSSGGSPGGAKLLHQ